MTKISKTKINTSIDSRPAALIHAFWIMLTSALIVGVFIDLNISLLWPIFRFIIGIIMIYICLRSALINIKRILLIDFIISACIVSFIMLGQQSEYSLVCYYSDGPKGNPVTANGLTAHLKVLLHNINGILDHVGLSFFTNETCLWLKPGNAIKTPWNTHIVELGIVTGQAVYALFLAETANRQLLEKERLKILL
jgi:hypothetical protein